MGILKKMFGKREVSHYPEPTTKEAKCFALGFWLHSLQLTVQSGALETTDKDALVSVGQKVFNLMKALGLTTEPEEGGNAIAQEVVRTYSVEFENFYDLGRAIASCAYPNKFNLLNHEDLIKLQQAMRDSGVLQSDKILEPLHALIDNKNTSTPQILTQTFYSIYKDLVQTLNNPSKLSYKMNKKEAVERALSNCSNIVPSTEPPNTIAANCLFMGFWTGTILRIANAIARGDFNAIVSALSIPAEQAMPYIKRIDFPIVTISQGYNAVVKELERKYSSHDATAYRIGFLLSVATSPHVKYHAQYDLKYFNKEIRKIGILELTPQLETLKLAIQKEDRELTLTSSMSILYSLREKIDQNQT